MAEWDYVIAPATVAVRFEVNEVISNMFSMILLNEVEYTSGLAGWITETAHALTPEQRAANKIVTRTLEGASYPSADLTFPDYIQQVNAMPDADLQDMALRYLQQAKSYPGAEAALADRETFYALALERMKEHYAEMKKDHNPELEADYWGLLFDLLQEPGGLRRKMVAHLQFMWDTYMRAEWEHVKPQLEEAYNAYSRLDYDNLTAHEAMEAVTGRDLRGMNKFEQSVADVNTLIFIPFPHLGPYVGWGPYALEGAMMFLFTARPPRNASAMESVTLSRNELLVRLNALADETRLRILELLTRQEEMCAQDFITQLDLSQSSASRHLRQLTASGYIAERRKDVAKCYTLNPDRIDDTIRSLRTFLKKN